MRCIEEAYLSPILSTSTRGRTQYGGGSLGSVASAAERYTQSFACARHRLRPVPAPPALAARCPVGRLRWLAPGCCAHESGLCSGPNLAHVHRLSLGSHASVWFSFRTQRDHRGARCWLSRICHEAGCWYVTGAGCPQANTGHCFSSSSGQKRGYTDSIKWGIYVRVSLINFSW